MAGKPLVMIVDDDVSVHRSVRALMGSLDHRVDAFVYGNDSLQSPTAGTVGGFSKPFAEEQILRYVHGALYDENGGGEPS